MCGRYGFSIKDAKEVIGRFDLINTLDEIEKLDTHYNIPPGTVNPVVVNTSEGYKMGRFMWGLMPSWAKDESMKWKTINARAEGIETKASYRKPFVSKRCLIPASFYFEWDKSTNPKTPYLIKMKNDEIFSFAGLYDIWKNPEGKDIYSFTIITTEPNQLQGRIHNRMPVILPKEDEKEWLNPDLIEPEQLHKFLKPYPDEKMEMYPVSSVVNVPKNDDASVIIPMNSQ